MGTETTKLTIVAQSTMSFVTLVNQEAKIKAPGMPGELGRHATDRVAVAHKFVREFVMDKTVLGTALKLKFATLLLVLRHQVHQMALSNL